MRSARILCSLACYVVGAISVAVVIGAFVVHVMNGGGI